MAGEERWAVSGRGKATFLIGGWVDFDNDDEDDGRGRALGSIGEEGGLQDFNLPINLNILGIH